MYNEITILKWLFCVGDVLKGTVPSGVLVQDKPQVIPFLQEEAELADKML